MGSQCCSRDISGKNTLLKVQRKIFKRFVSVGLTKAGYFQLGIAFKNENKFSM